MFTIKLGCCGDDCSVCPRYVATLSGSKDELKEAVKLSKKVGWNLEKTDPEEFVCHGCQDIESCEYKVKECCIEKNIENCGQCVNYPCPIIENAFEITRGYVEKFKNLLSEAEYKTFQKAFFSKKENLDKVRNETFS